MHVMYGDICSYFIVIKQDLGGGLNKIGMNLLGVEDLGLKVSWASVIPRSDLLLDYSSA